MSLKDRYADSYNSRNFNSGNLDIFDFSTLPFEVEYFKPEEGVNIIDIIPYVVKSTKHPRVKMGKMQVGDEDYVLDLFIHTRVGASNTTVICPKGTYGKPCPICESAESYKKEGKLDEYRRLKAKRYCYYNVLDRADGDKLKIFAVSHFLFEKELIDEAKINAENGGFVDFASIEEGKSIRFRGSPTKIGTVEYLEFKGFQFVDRTPQVKKHVVEAQSKAISFPDYMVVHTYDQLFALLNGVDEDDVAETLSEVIDEPVITAKAKAVVHNEEPEEVKNPANPCPYGHTWHVDNDNTSDCDECANQNLETWKKCAKGV